MPTHRDRPTDKPSPDKPSIVDLVTDPERFDQWQRQRQQEEAADKGPTSPDRHPDDRGRDS